MFLLVKGIFTWYPIGNKVFHTYLDQCVIVFIDDTLVYSKNAQEQE